MYANGLRVYEIMENDANIRQCYGCTIKIIKMPWTMRRMNLLKGLSTHENSPETILTTNISSSIRPSMQYSADKIYCWLD